MKARSIDSKPKPRLYDWSLLNREHKDIVQDVLAQWQSLVASDENEPRFQRFLSEHAGMFFGNGGTGLVISQLQLGSERRPDFVVVHDGRSGGLHYQFIELKKPSTPPGSRRDSPSQHLNRALQQVRDWDYWLSENRELVRTLLPAKFTTGRSCSYTIFIGRRDNTIEFLGKRNQLSSDQSGYRLNIRSYDALTDELASRQFRDSSAPWVSGDDLTLNQLANPFFKAISHKSWCQLLKHLEQCSYEGLAAYGLHFLTCAGKELVKFQKLNGLHDEFAGRCLAKGVSNNS